jgi:hypothetical protein
MGGLALGLENSVALEMNNDLCPHCNVVQDSATVPTSSVPLLIFLTPNLCQALIFQLSPEPRHGLNFYFTYFWL